MFAADLTTLEVVRGLLDMMATDTDSNPQLRRFISQTSQLIPYLTRRYFVPYLATKKFGPDARRNALDLALHDDLLQVNSVTNGTGAAISSGYNLRPDNSYPKNLIELQDDGAIFWEFQYRYQRVMVVGIWGHHPNYDVAWGNSLDTVEDNPLTSGATEVTVNDADGLDDRGLLRFDVCDYLLVESEQMYVTAINTSTNKLTVKRGVNGTTATAHVQDTPISVYRQDESMRWAANEITKWMWENRKDVHQTLQLQELGVVIANDLPRVYAYLEHLRPKTRFHGV